MTTQSDRERAFERARHHQGIHGDPQFVKGYLSACKAKDLEWQAKVQGLVELIGPAIAAFRGSGNGAQAICAVENLEHALTQFTSGQPAKGVMVPIDVWNVIYSRAYIAFHNENFSEKDRSKLWNAINGIWKDGGK